MKHEKHIVNDIGNRLEEEVEKNKEDHFPEFLTTVSDEELDFIEKVLTEKQEYDDEDKYYEELPEEELTKLHEISVKLTEFEKNYKK